MVNFPKKVFLRHFRVVMGRCRYFASVSVFVFLVGFYKVGWVFGVSFLQESLANAKVSARQQCVYEDP